MGTNKRKTSAMAKASKSKSAAPAKSSKGTAISKKAPAAKAAKAATSPTKSKAPATSKSAAGATSRPKGGKAAAPAKKKAAAPKKKVPGALKRKERFDEATTAEDEENERRVISDGPDHAEDDTGGHVSEDEDNVADKKARAAKGADTRTPQQITADENKAKKRANGKARTRGYRVLASRAGYSNDASYSTPGGAHDVAVPLTTPGEAIRACKWAPTQADKPAFGGLIEFEERSALSLESLPKSAARVLQMNGENYLRRIVGDATQLMVDQCKPKITPAMVASVTRKLQGVQKYSFVAPHGLVRFSQEDATSLRTPMWTGEEDDIEKEQTLLDLQKEMQNKLKERAELVKEGALLKESDPKYNAEVAASYDEVQDEIQKLREQAVEASLA
jgi:hypothetical protein